MYTVKITFFQKFHTFLFLFRPLPLDEYITKTKGHLPNQCGLTDHVFRYRGVMKN